MSFIRPAQVAGHFYPSNPDKLRKDLNLLLDVTKPKDFVCITFKNTNSREIF